MKASFIATLCAFLFPQAFSQSTTYVEATVPTGVPVAGNYTGALRPQVHYSPPKNFMNDPNGCFRDANGTWHLYYQYDATDLVAGNQHWGHATSPDLYHWTNQPIAIYAINASSYIFTGSAVIDSNNTSGFFPGQDNGVVAIFTIATYAPVMLQSQGLAYSHDGGYTFEMYRGNPVLDIGSDQFRDPKVFWYQDHWVMAISYAQEFAIGLFTSKDLKQWDHASNFTHHGLTGLQYECPNLVEVPVADSNDTMWFLQISINPGAPLGGSISQYFIGMFDGYTFSPMDNETRITDFSKDAYAGQFFNDLPSGQAVSINWASNWEYSQVVPTGELEGWRSSMGIPRNIAVREVERLGFVQVTEFYGLSSIMGQQLAKQSLLNQSVTVDYTNIYSNAVYFKVNATNIPTANSSGTFNFTFTSPITGENFQGGFFFGGDTPFWINRGNCHGFDNPFFTDKFSTNNLLDGSWTMEGIIDRSIFETISGNGMSASTTTFFSKQPLTVLTLATSGLPSGNMSVEIQINALNSAWASMENANGTVLGNVTTQMNDSSMLMSNSSASIEDSSYPAHGRFLT